ncbi:MAG: dihydrodipicolinate synthase family protein, partial [Gemmatimonadaceae bacterium]
VMSGADTRLTEAFALGAAGCTGGIVNIVPELMLDIYHCCTAGRPQEAAVSAARMVEVGRVIDQITFPLNVAAGLAARGYAPGVSKSIVSPASRALSASIEAELRTLLVHWGLALGPAPVAA